jgi:hypothetical protein
MPTLDPNAWQSPDGCESGTCVNVQKVSGENAVALRDSKDPDGPVLTFDLDEWDRFTTAVKRGEFEF